MRTLRVANLIIISRRYCPESKEKRIKTSTRAKKERNWRKMTHVHNHKHRENGQGSYRRMTASKPYSQFVNCDPSFSQDSNTWVYRNQARFSHVVCTGCVGWDIVQQARDEDFFTLFITASNKQPGGWRPGNKTTVSIKRNDDHLHPPALPHPCPTPWRCSKNSMGQDGFAHLLALLALGCPSFVPLSNLFRFLELVNVIAGGGRDRTCI